MTKKLYARHLERANACTAHILLFEQVFPEGTIVSAETLSRAVGEGLNIWWLIEMLPVADKTAIVIRALDRAIESGGYPLEVAMEMREWAAAAALQRGDRWNEARTASLAVESTGSDYSPETCAATRTLQWARQGAQALGMYDTERLAQLADLAELLNDAIEADEAEDGS